MQETTGKRMPFGLEGAEDAARAPGDRRAGGSGRLAHLAFLAGSRGSLGARLS